LIDVSVIISVYSIDRADDVVDCIISLEKQTLIPKEIIVVLDPNSALVTFYSKLLGSSVKLVVSDAFGLSAARNMGVRSCDSEIVAFIDDDAVADPNWLENLVGNFVDTKVIGVGGRIAPIWSAKKPNWLPEELYWIIGCSYKGLPTNKEPIRNPIGCNMAFRRSLFEKVGYFSTNVGRFGNQLLGHDDTEFGIRATNMLKGTKIIYDTEAVVKHKVSKNRAMLRYVLRRSYAEGFSKALVTNATKITGSILGTEKMYVRSIFLNIPSFFSKDNALTGPSRLIILFMSMAIVFLGYYIGSRTKLR
jgi:GT2 family glycosyltransferase